VVDLNIALQETAPLAARQNDRGAGNAGSNLCLHAVRRRDTTTQPKVTSISARQSAFSGASYPMLEMGRTCLLATQLREMEKDGLLRPALSPVVPYEVEDSLAAEGRNFAWMTAATPCP
jgi:hypothetical protein